MPGLVQLSEFSEESFFSLQINISTQLVLFGQICLMQVNLWLDFN